MKKPRSKPGSPEPLPPPAWQPPPPHPHPTAPQSWQPEPAPEPEPEWAPQPRSAWQGDDAAAGVEEVEGRTWPAPVSIPGGEQSAWIINPTIASVLQAVRQPTFQEPHDNPASQPVSPRAHEPASQQASKPLQRLHPLPVRQFPEPGPAGPPATAAPAPALAPAPAPALPVGWFAAGGVVQPEPDPEPQPEPEPEPEPVIPPQAMHVALHLHPQYVWEVRC